MASSPAMLHTLQLDPFVDALPLLQPVEVKSDKGVPTLRITMQEIYAQVHRDMKPTRMWSYGSTSLAPLIDVPAHKELHIEWINALPSHHFLPIDHSLHGCGYDVPDTRTAVHLHGARVAHEDDGYPEDWFLPGQSRTCRYPLNQDATALWYHDHAMGINRLNIYAGLFGMLLLRDAHEDTLNLPCAEYEQSLILYDRSFASDGQLFYPTSGDPEHPWVPEFSADAILINGKIRPYMDVAPRFYRFRVLNAANSRFFRLSVAQAGALLKGAAHQIPFYQIGADQGLLPRPVELRMLVLAPGERADLLVNFSDFQSRQLYLRNGSFDVMQFRVSQHHQGGTSPVGVVSPGSPSPDPFVLPDTLRFLESPQTSDAVAVRTITLNEYRDAVGNSMAMLINRSHWHDPVTEQPRINTTEIWEFLNLTEDTHPMHLHLVRFRILDRRPFDRFAYLMRNERHFTGPAIQAETSEAGWKDVVQCDPGTITRVLIHFEGFTGRYLYHCHVLEHEANDMMRPFDVIS